MGAMPSERGWTRRGTRDLLAEGLRGGWGVLVTYTVIALPALQGVGRLVAAIGAVAVVAVYSLDVLRRDVPGLTALPAAAYLRAPLLAHVAPPVLPEHTRVSATRADMVYDLTPDTWAPAVLVSVRAAVGLLFVVIGCLRPRVDSGPVPV
jgi:hypothetical protein